MRFLLGVDMEVLETRKIRPIQEEAVSGETRVAGMPAGRFRSFPFAGIILIRWLRVVPGGTLRCLQHP
jgi:hypothetical protein